MRLVEAIVDANRRFVRGETGAALNVDEFSAALPVVALTCIDPRLNRLLPDSLGIPETEFIWLRNAGNIIFGPTSTMMRTLALACALKRGKEIIILGHTDCRVRQTTVLELTDRFKELGIERHALPDDLVDFFGLFASERQNVLKAVGFARGSFLIGPRVPVHGMLIDITNGSLEWVVNGYDALDGQTIGTTAPHPNGVATPYLHFGDAIAAEVPTVLPPPPFRHEGAPPPLPKSPPLPHKKTWPEPKRGKFPLR